MRAKTYYSLFRIRFINNLQYRAVVLGAIMKGFLWALMEILAYSALYRTNGSAFSMSFSQTVSYVWLLQAFFTLFSVVFGDGEIYTTISSGSIAYDLVRPVDLYGRWFCQSASNRLSFAIVHCFPILIPGFFMPEPYRLSLPAGPGHFLLFLISVLLAFGVVVACAMLMYVLLFYIVSQRGIRIIVAALTGFFSGGIIPLPFFPPTVLKVVQMLPFAAMQNMPLQIYCGNIIGMEAVKGILFQGAWLAVLILSGKWAMSRATKKVIVQGG